MVRSDIRKLKFHFGSVPLRASSSLRDLRTTLISLEKKKKKKGSKNKEPMSRLGNLSFRTVCRKEVDSPWSWLVCICASIIVALFFGFSLSFGLMFPVLMEYFQTTRERTGKFNAYFKISIGTFLNRRHARRRHVLLYFLKPITVTKSLMIIDCL